MIGKLKKGASFGGCIRYVTGKDEAKILASDGVLLGTNAEIAQSFELQRQLNPRIKKPVGHIALSFKPEDNPHCHIVYNRINNEGKLISDAHDYRRNEQVTKALKSKYGLTYGTDKSKTNTRKLRNAERAKYEVHNAVKDALKMADSWEKFKSELEKRGIHLELVYKDKERTKVQGIRFCKDGYSFKGTQISRESWMQGLVLRRIVYRQELNPCREGKQVATNGNRLNQQQNMPKPLGVVSLPLTYSHRPMPRLMSHSQRMNKQT